MESQESSKNQIHRVVDQKFQITLLLGLSFDTPCIERSLVQIFQDYKRYLLTKVGLDRSVFD